MIKRWRHIESLAQLRAQLAAGEDLRGCVLQGLDLRELSVSTFPQVAGAVFLGCRLAVGDDALLLEGGAMLFPNLGEGRPYQPYRPRLYSVSELMEGFDGNRAGTFEDTRDSKIYRHFQDFRAQQPAPIMEALAQRIHDHAIDDALGALLAPAGGTPRRVVGIMGGHAMHRGEADYRQIAEIARQLTHQGYFVATGGGPGAMEAGNLGAWMAGYSEAELGAAVAQLAGCVDYREHDYLVRGYRVLADYPTGKESLSIPTWFYGHEPSNQFATHIAKYFSNSLREDGLLAIAKHGVIYAPGSAGTVQEVFMDAAQNHYGTFEVVSPMVFLGTREWTETRPVLPLLEQLAGTKRYRELIAAVDSVEAAVRFIVEHPPVPYTG